MRFRFVMLGLIFGMVVVLLVLTHPDDRKPSGSKPEVRAGEASPSVPGRPVLRGKTIHRSRPRVFREDAGSGTAVQPGLPPGPKGGAEGPNGLDLPAVPDAIPNEYVLRFFNAGDKAAFVRIAKRLGIDILDDMALGHALRLRGSEAMLSRAIAESPAPVGYERNVAVAPPPPPQAPAEVMEEYRGFGDLVLALLGVDGGNSGWGKGVTVAVLDTAVGRHRSLLDAQIRRVDRFGLDAGGAKAGHGTAVASLVVGGDERTPGIAPSANLIGIPVVSGTGTGDAFTVAKGIVDAVNLGADVINMSLGTYGDSPILQQAIRYAMERDVIIVAAAGNDAAGNLMYPARYPGVIAVGAADAQGLQLPFSNHGPGLDIVAPGLGLSAAWDDDRNVLFSGTSAAAPIVSGAIAALMSMEQGMSGLEAAESLLGYANDGGAPGPDDDYGNGVLDLGRVLERNTRGIYDVAAIAPYIVPGRDSDSHILVQLYAQNRGTETINSIRLHVRIEAGQERVILYQDVRVGDVLVRDVRIPRAEFSGDGKVLVSHSAEIVGIPDARPQNNGRRSVIRVVLPNGS